MINNDTHRSTPNGDRVTYYGFCCGYVETAGRKDYPSATLKKDGCYHVLGFDGTRTRFWHSFDYLTEARKFLAKFAKEHGEKITTEADGN